MNSSSTSAGSLVARRVFGKKLVLAPIILMGSFSLLQGVPSYFFTLGLPAVLRESGATLDLIGFTYVVWLPFAFKWLWAPWFDRSTVRPFGGRLVWLRFLAFLLAGFFLLVALFRPETSPWVLIALSLLCACVGATIQLILASWLIENADVKSRAVANAAGVAAMVLGAMVGSGFVLRLNDLFSWEMSIVAVSLTVLVFSLPAWVLKQDHPVTVKSTGTTVVERPGVAAWCRFLGHDRIGPMVLAIVCFGMAAGADVLVPALLIDRGYSASEAGWLLGTVATGSVIPASFAMGYLLRRFGVIAVMGLLYVAKAGVLFALIWAVHFSPATVAALAIGDFCLAGALTVGTWQLYMNFASREHSATDYGLMTSLDAFLRFLGGLSAGQVAVYIGYGSVFAGAALGALGACFFCFLLRERHSAEAGR